MACGHDGELAAVEQGNREQVQHGQVHADHAQEQQEVRQSPLGGLVRHLGDGDGRTLEASLRRLETMDIDVLVPGHGPVVRGADVGDWLRWGADYLRGVRERVREQLRDTVPIERVAAAVPYAEFVGDRLSRQRHGMASRHDAAVAKIIEEERTRL